MSIEGRPPAQVRRFGTCRPVLRPSGPSMWYGTLSKSQFSPLTSSAGLVTMCSGSTAGIDRQRCVVLIKATGTDYDCMRSVDMVVTNLEGRKLKGQWNPSVDLPGHFCIYKHCQKVGARMRGLCSRDVRLESGDVACF